MRKIYTKLILLLSVISGYSSCNDAISYDDYYTDMNEVTTARSANDFLNSIGVNTSIDNRGEYLEKTIECAKYMGFRWIRSGVGGGDDLTKFDRLYNEAGVRFSLGLGSGQSKLQETIEAGRIFAQRGYLIAFEGNNEPNNWAVEYEGEIGGGPHSWLPVAKLQRDLYSAVKNDPLLKDYPVWSLSAGGAQNDNVGLQFLTIPEGANTLMPDGTQYADYANCHNYILHPGWPGLHNNQTWLSSDPSENSPLDGMWDNYGLTWANKFIGYSPEELLTLPRVTTETGTTIDEYVSEEQQARLYMAVYLSQFKRGWDYTAMYILRDRSDEGGNQTFGFYTTAYTPRKAAHYLHNMTTILADEGTIENPGQLAYTIPKKPDTVHHLLLQKQDGTFMLVVWGEKYEGGSDRINVNFDDTFNVIRVYDPTFSSDATETLYNVDSVTLTMTDHPYILEIQK